MDCGPAALKAILEGFGVSASYGRLREACQTDVDGTSIDTIEDIARELGLDAEQNLVPVEHVLRAESLPALVVVRLPSGFTHFVVAWRAFAGRVQVMDPATGRRWMSASRFVRELYVHEMPLPISTFLDWAQADDFRNGLAARLRALGCTDVEVPREDWRAIAKVDAAARMTEALIRTGALRRGPEAARAFALADEGAIPARYWTARSAGEDMVTMRAAVVLHIRGRTEKAPVSPDLVAALNEAPTSPARELVRLGWPGAGTLSLLILALAGATIGTLLEAILFRGAFSVGRELGVVQQRLGGVGAFAALLVLLLALEIPIVRSGLRAGRALETRLRVAFLRKIPRLGDRYLASRPVSDMAQRSHAIHNIRNVPAIALQATRTMMEIALTALGIAWLDPTGAPAAAIAAVLSIAVPLAAQPVLAERDLRMRTHNAAMGRFYFDALLGLAPIRTHRAERAVEREHQALVVEWARAAGDVVRAYIGADFVQSLIGMALTAWLLVRYVSGAGDPTGAILLVYWALNLPLLGQELGAIARQYPQQRNETLRFLEPLGAPEDGGAHDAAPARGACELVLEQVRVVAGGHAILEDVDLRIAPGEHVAIVGASGAGKSSLFGLLLGWHRPSAGRVLVDGKPLTRSLRDQCAWVDPGVALWNRSALDNLVYGLREGVSRTLPRAIEVAELHSVLDRLPDGLKSPLGEGGSLVSGGEGQRVRFGRALMKKDARLVLLDEPFRGLDRDRRRALLARARTWWKDATLLCVTHDVGDAADFDRVLVVEGGRIVEDARPGEGARYREALEAEASVFREVWSRSAWRRVRVDGGEVAPGVASIADARTARRTEVG
jgi:ATP-binding cassette subfamily B protein